MALNPELKTIFESLCNEHKQNLNDSYFKAANVFSNNYKINDFSSIDVVTYSLINDNFTLNITYSDGNGHLLQENYVLDSFISFTKNNSELMFSIYDLLKIIDKDNFKCYTLYNVNSKERLNDCFKYLVDELEKVTEKIINLTTNDIRLNGLFREKCYELQTFFGPFIFNPNEIRNLPKYSLEYFYCTRFNKFNDKAYNYYLDGKYSKAVALYKKRIRMNEYEFALLDHMRSYSNMQSYKTGKQIYEALPENLRYKNEVTKVKSKGKPIYSLVFPVSFLGFTVIYALLFRFFRYISYRGSYFLISDSLSNRLTMLIPALFTALTVSTYIKQNLLIKDDALPIELRNKLGKLMDIETIKKHRRRSVTTMLIVSIICIALGANNSVAFYDIGFKDSTTHLTLKNDFYLYSEIDTVYIIDNDEKNPDYNDKIIIKLKKDEKLRFTDYNKMTNKEIEKLKEICKDNDVKVETIDSTSKAK